MLRELRIQVLRDQISFLTGFVKGLKKAVATLPDSSPRKIFINNEIVLPLQQKIARVVAVPFSFA